MHGMKPNHLMPLLNPEHGLTALCFVWLASRFPIPCVPQVGTIQCCSGHWRILVIANEVAERGADLDLKRGASNADLIARDFEVHGAEKTMARTRL